VSELTVDVSDLLSHPGDRRPISLEGEITGGTDLIRIVSPVTVNALAESTGSGVIVKGIVSASIALVCVRCLVDWDEQLAPTLSALFESVDDPDIFPIAEGLIDLEPPARDELLAAVPVNAIHAPDCKGLCGSCGADLNKGECGCDEIELSSPFAGLKELMDLTESTASHPEVPKD